MFDVMIKTITKIGNSQGIMLDAALMDLARLKVGDQVNLTVHEGGAIYLTPVRPVVTPDEAAASAKRVIARNRELFRRLS
jgi:antitoxin component of MazEF toxin-antitoxin module